MTDNLCRSCNRVKPHYAKGMCHTCYEKVRYRSVDKDGNPVKAKGEIAKRRVTHRYDFIKFIRENEQPCCDECQEASFGLLEVVFTPGNEQLKTLGYTNMYLVPDIASKCRVLCRSCARVYRSNTKLDT